MGASIDATTSNERPHLHPLLAHVQVLADQSADGESVMRNMRDASTAARHVYSKQMGKFFTCVSRKWLKEGVHIVRSLPSFLLLFGSALAFCLPLPSAGACLVLRLSQRERRKTTERERQREREREWREREVLQCGRESAWPVQRGG